MLKKIGTAFYVAEYTHPKILYHNCYQYSMLGNIKFIHPPLWTHYCPILEINSMYCRRF